MAELLVIGCPGDETVPIGGWTIDGTMPRTSLSEEAEPEIQQDLDAQAKAEMQEAAEA